MLSPLNITQSTYNDDYRNYNYIGQVQNKLPNNNDFEKVTKPSPKQNLENFQKPESIYKEDNQEIVNECEVKHELDKPEQKSDEQKSDEK
jgi:hypothetical protein